MAKFNGVSAAWETIRNLRSNSGLFFRIALPWIVIHLIFAAGGFLYLWATTPGLTDLDGALAYYRYGDNLQLQTLATVIPDLVGSLAVSIYWIRHQLLGSMPPEGKWFAIPVEGGRFFARQLLLGLIFIAGLIPGLVLMGLIGDLFPPASKYIAFAILGLTALTMVFVCVRLLLIFPAIALGNSDITMRRSYLLSGGLWPGMTVALIAATVATLVAMLLLLLPIEFYLPTSPGAYITAVLMVFEETVISAAMLALDAICWGIVAMAYRMAIADQAQPQNEKGDIAAAP